MGKIWLLKLLAWMQAKGKKVGMFGDREEDLLDRTRRRLAELHADWRKLDEETQYRIAKESAAQLGRTDEAFIQELLQQMR